jgi:hypothetical protein
MYLRYAEKLLKAGDDLISLEMEWMCCNIILVTEIPMEQFVKRY